MNSSRASRVQLNPCLTMPRTSPLTAFIRALAYWCWGGILEAARLGRRIKDAPYTQFHTSFLTMLLGVALLCPGEMWTPLSTFLKLWMPEWLWGTILLCVGRVGLHSMLLPACPFKCRAAAAMLGCWVFLSVVTLLNSGLSIGVIVFTYVAWRCGDLMKQVCGEKC